MASILYIMLFGNRILPSDRLPEETASSSQGNETRQIEAVVGPRFKGINRPYRSLDFMKRYGARLMDVRHNGESLMNDTENLVFKEGDTLVIEADESFFNSWGDSSEAPDSAYMVLSKIDRYRIGSDRVRAKYAILSRNHFRKSQPVRANNKIR